MNNERSFFFERRTNFPSYSSPLSVRSNAMSYPRMFEDLVVVGSPKFVCVLKLGLSFVPLRWGSILMQRFRTVMVWLFASNRCSTSSSDRSDAFDLACVGGCHQVSRWNAL
jgi:hypothetical protein